MKPDKNVLRSGRDAVLMELFISRTALVDSVELLHQANHNIACFSQGKLLTEAETRPAVEWKVFPPEFPFSPALRLEFIGVRAPDVLAPVNDVDRVRNLLALFDVYWRQSIGSTAPWQRRVLRRDSSIDWHRREEPQCFAENVLKIGATFEATEG